MSESDLGSIRNSCDVFEYFPKKNPPKNFSYLCNPLRNKNPPKTAPYHKNSLLRKKNPPKFLISQKLTGDVLGPGPSKDPLSHLPLLQLWHARPVLQPPFGGQLHFPEEEATLLGHLGQGWEWADPTGGQRLRRGPGVSRSGAASARRAKKVVKPGVKGGRSWKGGPKTGLAHCGHCCAYTIRQLQQVVDSWTTYQAWSRHLCR